MENTPALARLKAHLAQLKQDAQYFDTHKLFNKNRYMQAQQGLFAPQLFATKSMLLTDYVEEISQQLEHLPAPQLRHQHQYALTKITEQIEAIVKVLKATSIWQQQNKPAPYKKATPQQYKQQAQKILAPINELYQELTKNHEFERRLQDKLAMAQQQLKAATKETQPQLNTQVLTLHQRLGRCRKAISECEEKIQRAEKQQMR